MRVSEQQPSACRVCDKPIREPVDWIVTPNCDDPVPVYRCKSCNHYSLFPDQYQQQKSFEWDGVGFYLRDRTQREAAARQILARLCRVYRNKNHCPPKSFLDAGCAIGLTLLIAESQGMNATGIEPEVRLAEYGRTTLQVDVRHGMLSDFDPPEQVFDLIYCEQVLEHVAQPALFLKKLVELLAPNGLIYIGVPPVFPLNHLSTFMIRNMQLPLPSSAVTNIFQDPDEHVSVFTRRSMLWLAEHCGLDLKPLPLTLSTLTPKRLARLVLTVGASPGTYLLSRKAV